MTPISPTNSTQPLSESCPPINRQRVIVSIALAALAIGVLLIAPNASSLLHAFHAHPLAFGLGLGVPALIPLALAVIKWKEKSDFKPGRAGETPPTKPKPPQTAAQADHKERQERARFGNVNQ